VLILLGTVSLKVKKMKKSIKLIYTSLYIGIGMLNVIGIMDIIVGIYCNLEHSQMFRLPVNYINIFIMAVVSLICWFCLFNLDILFDGEKEKNVTRGTRSSEDGKS